MTDPELADRTYIEPLTREYVEEIIRLEAAMMTGIDGKRKGKFALLPTVGGQTALNLAVDLADAGILEKYDVELIGAKLDAIKPEPAKAATPAASVPNPQVWASMQMM